MALAYAGVCHRHGGVAAVDGVTLSLPVAATTVLIGPSGCGKSTLLRLAVGLAWPDAGTVTLLGETLGRDNLLRLRRRTGYVIQEGGLFPHLTVAENAGLLVRHLGWEPVRIAARCRELLDLVHLPHALLGRYPGELSGGERQRVSLVRALMPGPELLLLDEPLGALDPLVRAGVRATLREVFATLGCTVLLVTHDLAEAAELGAQLVLMRAGGIVQAGPARELLLRPATPFVEAFVRAQRDSLRILEEAGA